MVNYNVKRVERDIEKYIPTIIQRELTDELVKSITITDCLLTHDYSFCKVYFTSIIDMDKKALEKEVNEAAPVIRGKLAKLIDCRVIPELRFEYDSSIAYADNIERILDKIHEEEK